MNPALPIFTALKRASVPHWENTKQLLRWIADGRPVPAPHCVKEAVVLRYQKKTGIRAFVETGTYLGDMVHALRWWFDRLSTIELDAQLAARARERFATVPQIAVVHGDSAQVLPNIVAALTSPAIFWLDGHYSGGITAKGATETPIMRELEIILEHRFEHIVLIDDARLFDGTHDYPRLEEVRAFTRARRPGWEIQVADDVIRAHAPHLC